MLTNTTTRRRIRSFFLYGEVPRVSDERMMHIETIASRSASYQWRIDPHVHRSLHQLLFVADGRGVAFAEDTIVRYRSPTLVIVPAGTVHGFDFEPGADGFVVSMSEDLLAEAARREPGVSALFESPFVRECGPDAVRAVDLEESLSLCAREFNRASFSRGLALEGWLAVILAKVLRLADVYSQSENTTIRRRRALVARFRALIDRQLGQSSSVVEYAAALKVSEYTLRHACLSVTEQSPMQLVHARILLEAKRQLLYTDRSVSEIAYGLGYDDPAYFTRFFSRRTGASPSAFRLTAQCPEA